jgi:hypothetical protein
MAGIFREIRFCGRPKDSHDHRPRQIRLDLNGRKGRIFFQVTPIVWVARREGALAMAPEYTGGTTSQVPGRAPRLSSELPERRRRPQGAFDAGSITSELRYFAASAPNVSSLGPEAELTPNKRASSRLRSRLKWLPIMML